MSSTFKVGDKVWVTSYGVVETGELALPAEVTAVDNWKWGGEPVVSYTVKSLDDSFNEQGWGDRGVWASKEEAYTAGRDICRRLIATEVRRHRDAINRLAAVNSLA